MIPCPLPRRSRAGLSLMAVALVAVGCSSPETGSRLRPIPGLQPSGRPATTSGTRPRKIRGEASFYGAKYQGRLTANGERFDRNAMTAAHEVLSFGTRVRITNLRNNRSVVVRINDRFKSYKGRLIDLSEASFARIAPLGQGVIPIELEVLD